MRSRLPLILSSLALIVALSGVGPADAARAVRRALFAVNAGKLQGIAVSKTPRANRLLPLDSGARFPLSVLPSSLRGPRGPQGPAGPAGPAGPSSPPGTSSNPFVFRAHKVAVQDSAAASAGKVLLGGEDFDPHGDFDPADSTYTAPVAGYYQFSASVSVCCAGGRAFAQATTARADQTIRGTDVTAAGINRSVLSGLMKLQAGDKVQLDIYNETAQQVGVEGGQTFFAGALVTTG